MNWLIVAAEVVAFVHMGLYFLLPFVAFVENSSAKRSRLMVFMWILLIVTLPSQWLFSGDCPLRVFEFCLRGLGGETFDLFRFHTMGRLVAEGMTPLQIYNYLLWKTGLYLGILGTGMIIASLAIDAWWQKKSGEVQQRVG